MAPALLAALHQRPRRQQGSKSGRGRSKKSIMSPLSVLNEEGGVVVGVPGGAREAGPRPPPDINGAADPGAEDTYGIAGYPIERIKAAALRCGAGQPPQPPQAEKLFLAHERLRLSSELPNIRRKDLRAHLAKSWENADLPVREQYKLLEEAEQQTYQKRIAAWRARVRMTLAGLEPNPLPQGRAAGEREDSQSGRARPRGREPKRRQRPRALEPLVSPAALRDRRSHIQVDKVHWDAMTPAQREEALDVLVGKKLRYLAPYWFFTQSERAKLKAESPGLTFSEMGKRLGARWNALPPSERRRWSERANELRPAERPRIAVKLRAEVNAHLRQLGIPELEEPGREGGEQAAAETGEAAGDTPSRAEGERKRIRLRPPAQGRSVRRRVKVRAQSGGEDEDEDEEGGEEDEDEEEEGGEEDEEEEDEDEDEDEEQEQDGDGSGAERGRAGGGGQRAGSRVGSARSRSRSIRGRGKGRGRGRSRSRASAPPATAPTGEAVGRATSENDLAAEEAL